MSADGRSHRYGVKELWVAKKTADSAGSTTGPTYGAYRKLDGVTRMSVTNQDKIDKLPGEETVLGVEQTFEEAQVQLEFGKRNHSAIALLSGAATWQEPGKSRYVHGENSSSPDVKIVARCNKIGKSGSDVLVTVYNAKFGGDGVDLQGKAFGTNKMTGSAALTTSTMKVVRDGVSSYERVIWEESENLVGAPIVAASGDSTAPTLSSSSPADNATGASKTAAITITMSEDLDPNTVNEFTVLLKQGSSLQSGYTVSLADDTITITHAAFTGLTEYDVYITTQVADLNGNYVATEINFDFTTAA